MQHHNHHLQHHHTWQIEGKIYDTSHPSVYKLSDKDALYGVIDNDKFKVDHIMLARTNIALSKGMIPKDAKNHGVKLIGGLYEIKIYGEMRPYTTKKYHHEEADLLVFSESCPHSQINKIGNIDHPHVDVIPCLGADSSLEC